MRPAQLARSPRGPGWVLSSSSGALFTRKGNRDTVCLKFKGLISWWRRTRPRRKAETPLPSQVKVELMHDSSKGTTCLWARIQALKGTLKGSKEWDRIGPLPSITVPALRTLPQSLALRPFTNLWETHTIKWSEFLSLASISYSFKNVCLAQRFWPDTQTLPKLLSLFVKYFHIYLRWYKAEGMMMTALNMPGSWVTLFGSGRVAVYAWNAAVVPPLSLTSSCKFLLLPSGSGLQCSLFHGICFDSSLVFRGGHPPGGFLRKSMWKVKREQEREGERGRGTETLPWHV